jgi:hypothetical protein
VCEGVPETLAPWKDSELVSCEYDDSKDVAGGIIRIRTKPHAVSNENTPTRLSA